MKTIQLKNDKGERAVINDVPVDLLEGKRKPESEQEREDLANAQIYREKGFEPISAQDEEQEVKKKGNKKKVDPKADTELEAKE